MSYIRRSAKQEIVQLTSGALLNQAAPVQNTWYTLCDLAKKRIRVFEISFTVAAVGETLQLELTIDGQVLNLVDQVAVATTPYFPALTVDYNGAIMYNSNTTTSKIEYRCFLIECQRLKIRLRKTTAVGAGNLQASVCYFEFN
jgi:hypothetical protein